MGINYILPNFQLESRNILVKVRVIKSLIFKLVEFLKTLFIMIVKTTEIRFETLCERTSEVINKLELILGVFTVFSTGLRRLEIFRWKYELRILWEKRENLWKYNIIISLIFIIEFLKNMYTNVYKNAGHNETFHLQHITVTICYKIIKLLI